MPEKSGGTDYLPYGSIDRLFALCEASLERSAATAAATTRLEKFGQSKEAGANNGGGDLAQAFETAQERLVQYFKVRKGETGSVRGDRGGGGASACCQGAAVSCGWSSRL